jgi:hypothetical protein
MTAVFLEEARASIRAAAAESNERGGVVQQQRKPAGGTRSKGKQRHPEQRNEIKV